MKTVQRKHGRAKGGRTRTQVCQWELVNKKETENVPGALWRGGGAVLEKVAGGGDYCDAVLCFHLRSSANDGRNTARGNNKRKGKVEVTGSRLYCTSNVFVGTSNSTVCAALKTYTRRLEKFGRILWGFQCTAVES